MTVKIDGTNTEANPAFTGVDTDTGLQCGTNELKLVTGGTARATVDSSGNVGIGVTPSSWGGSRNAIQFDSAGAAYVCNDTTIGIVSNMYFDGSNNKYINAGTASSAYFQQDNVVFQFASSGSANGNGTFTTSTRIDADGVKFGSDTAAANALHDYEEGTFTPRLVIENVGDVTIYSNKKGSYVKVGSTVTAWFNVTVNGTPSGRSVSNAIEFHDLPFTSTDDDSDGAQYYIGSVRINGVDTSHTYGDFSEASIRLFNNNTMGRIELRDASTSALANSSLWLKDNTTIHATITYRTDA